MYTFNSKEELAEWISREVCGVSEAMEILESSRQNIHGFVKNGKLKPEGDKPRTLILSFRSAGAQGSGQGVSYEEG